MGIRRGPSIVIDNLIFAVDAANPDSYISGSTVWKDQTPNGNNGTLTNGPIFNSANAGVLEFDGSDDYVSVGNPTFLQLTGAMTIDFWINGQPTTTGQYAGFDKLGNASNRGAGLDLRKATGIYLYIASNSSTLVETHTTDTTPLTDGNWHHVVGTYDPGTSMKIYLDGVEVSSKTSSVPASQYNAGSNEWSIAKRSAHSNPLNGKMASVKMYDRALSAAEVSQNYNALKTRFGL